MLRKIGDDEIVCCNQYENPYCTHPEHNPPIYNKPLKPGKYEYICPSCEFATIIIIQDKLECN